MSLKQWADNGWLRPLKTSRKEIAGLLAIVERDLVDAEGGISADWRFGIAYNGALKLCTILLHASGYRPEKALQHYRTIAALPLVLGDERKDDADYLETCRRKRNTAEYEMAGVAPMKTPRSYYILQRSYARTFWSGLRDTIPNSPKKVGVMRSRVETTQPIEGCLCLD